MRRTLQARQRDTSIYSALFIPRYFLPRLLVLVASFLDNFFTHAYALLPLQALLHQPIPQVLLIEALLASSNFV